MAEPLHSRLSRRERQIMDAVYQLGEASCADVVRRLPDRPAYNTIRVTLGILEKKGFLTHRQDGQRYIYRPVISADKAKKSALSHVLKTFYTSSPASAILALLDMNTGKLTRADLDEIQSAIAQARKES